MYVVVSVTPYQQQFILHFGEMGSRWGINRTVGQIYALLFVSEDPLNADQITESLAMSRSNVSMGLKELQSWRLVRPQHQVGDRREYFSAPDDIWEILRTLVHERRKREIDPTLTMLRGALLENPTNAVDTYARDRMDSMLELMELVTGWVDDIQNLDQKTIIALMKLGGGIKKLVIATQRLTTKSDSPEEPQPDGH